ncbi:HEAT repeat domain-containing protein [Streptomyces sp. DSM 44915]|uniref:HEAT repeat domain-containing protein n=1 Tax=Streptomyces chisholmiae TaxID=3075540 RepID=A0ABU2JM23_9ACTN|nr:HEAT repeat domain-containing protein [Streptomyces sp. DSM 44915]MDT0265783.1 HEAT repeat domain-containing protein [Streptomyces sp. DSM 44915]
MTRQTGRQRETGPRETVPGLADGRPSVRLRAALAAGTAPDPGYVEHLVARCAVEPDFSVREMLTWALTRHPADRTVPTLVAEVRAPGAQARAQAWHTLSKIGDRRAWPAVTPAALADPDDEAARSAWRAAVTLVPADAAGPLATLLSGQLGRGPRETRRSLSRALIALGEAMDAPLRAALTDPDPRVRAHAIATERLARDPESGFDSAIEEARRVVALGPTDGSER